MSESNVRFGMGWLPDYPEFRDYTMDRDEVSPSLGQLGQRDSIRKMLFKTGATKTRNKTE